jgi:adenine-specific DNA-methyltransferase
MKRRYIGVEQMDYIEEVSIARLKKVLEGEQGGISRTNGWEGGGSFVYCELMKDTQNDIERILGAKDEELLQIFDELPQSKSRKYFIKNLDKEGFLALNSKDKKKILLDCVNKNNLYVNLSEIDDEDYAVSDNDKMLTKRLYSFE